jgi:hypothetical protein
VSSSSVRRPRRLGQSPETGLQPFLLYPLKLVEEKFYELRCTGFSEVWPSSEPTTPPPTNAQRSEFGATTYRE